MNLLTVPDKLPAKTEEITAVFSNSYCFAKGKNRLTHMNVMCTKRAAELAKTYTASRLLLSSAYDSWVEEWNIRKAIALNIAPRIRTFPIGKISDTFEEVWRVRNILLAMRSQPKLIVVAEKFHMPRVALTFKLLTPEIELYPVSVACPVFEQTKEPSRIKSFRAGYKSLWIAWHMSFLFITPLIIRRMKAKKMLAAA